MEGTGSFLQLSEGDEGEFARWEVEDAIRKAHTVWSWDDEKDDVKSVFKIDSLTERDMTMLRGMRLRYFTPSEIAKIHCLSSNFQFPSSISRKQCWKVLGNGLNAHVVAVLMRLLLTEKK